MPYDSPPRSRRRDDSHSRSPARRHRNHSRDPDRRKPHRQPRSRSRSPPRRDTHSYKSRRIEKPDAPSSSSRRPRSRSPRRYSPVRRSKPLPSQQDSFALTTRGSHSPPPIVKELPNFAPSGLLAKEANTVAGTNIVLKYHEPADARKPSSSSDWRLFIFKGSEETEPPAPLSAQSCWLLGRERAVADIWVQHPSASKQHAVLQFRGVTKKSGDEFDVAGRRVVKLYAIDLESSNGTWLNGERLPAKRFVEVKSGDVLKIGSSEREYVFMQPPKE